MTVTPNKRTLTIHPFILAIYPILFFFDLNKNEVRFSDTLIPMTASLAVALLLLLLLKCIFKEITKAGVLTSCILILFYSYEAIRTEIAENGTGALILSLDPDLFWSYGILLTIITTGLLFWKVKDRRITKCLNLVSLILFSFPMVSIANHKISYQEENLFPRNQSDHIAVPENFKYTGPKPDIYYIILDGYMRHDVMKEFWNFNNSGFIKSLEDREFYVAPKSRSNYSSTVYSLASSLNMEYIPTISETEPVSKNTIKIPYLKAIEINRVVNFLKSMGYLYVHLSDDAAETQKNKQVDLLISNRKYISLFWQYLLNKTILKVHSLNEIQYKRNNILYGFKKLEEIPKNDGPTFTFAHFLMPHSPQAFNENGDLPTQAQSEQEKYFREVLYANKQIQRLVDHILANSKLPPIILIQGDHGYFSGPPTRLHTYPVEKGFGILSAYYLPGPGKEKLYEDITPTNSFRLIFDHYFGTHFDLLEDKSFLTFGYGGKLFFLPLPSEGSLSKSLSYWTGYLEGIILKRPHIPEAYALLGLCYADLERFEDAVDSFDKAIRLDPDLAWARVDLAQVYFLAKNYSKALDEILQAIHLNPNLAHAQMVLGNIQLVSGNFKEALSAFYKAKKVNPNDSEITNKIIQVHLNWGNTFLKNDQIESALDEYKEALKLNPDHFPSYVYLADAQAKSGKVDQVRMTYETALLKQPDHAGIHKNLGIIYSQENENKDKALFHLEESIRLDPNQTEAIQIREMIQTLKSG
ncbi:MAG: tetratricopeptide repeat protein [Nitrospina sp.]|jgi:tetratricopeptide (TPR) repeat protein|nr:tetratricopeptide repeat protein [Nitrospina sp.]